MTRRAERSPLIHAGARLAAGLALLCQGTVADFAAPVHARELLPQKEQTDTGYGQLQLPSFDQQRRDVPQSMFVWIVMAKGYEVEWDSFGRKGWYTQDPRIRPVDPASSFSPDVPAIYIVFEVPPLEDPAQFSAQWFLEDEQGRASDHPVGQDSLFIPWHEKHGFLELKKPADGWAKGSYLVKIYISSEGQQVFHAANQVGTMRFKITDQPAAAAPPASK
jgi:hypothetical protein